MSILIQIANLADPDFIALIEAHKALMLDHSPPESSHALLVDGLKSPEITVWEIRKDQVLVGCGALKQLSPAHGEIKSMHTIARVRRIGLGRNMLEHVLETARQRRYQRLSLETGSMDAFLPARRLYEAYGFEYCAPFGEYSEDPNSVFMTLRL